jgi:hypothetical protein
VRLSTNVASQAHARSRAGTRARLREHEYGGHESQQRARERERGDQGERHGRRPFAGHEGALRQRDLLEPDVTDHDVAAITSLTTPSMGFYVAVVLLALFAPKGRRVRLPGDRRDRRVPHPRRPPRSIGARLRPRVPLGAQLAS